MKFRLPYKITYALAGLILGIGSPAGYLILLQIFQNGRGLKFFQAIHQDIINNDLTITYMTVGTCLVFGFFGYLLGSRDDRLRGQNIQLEKTAKRKDEYLNICSHDIKSPLTIIAMGTRMLLEGKRGDLTERQEEMVARINKQAESSLNLVNDLMSLGMLESPYAELRFRTLEVSDLINHCVQDLGVHALEKSLSMEYKNPEEQIFFEGDDIRFRQLIRNLLDNAIKFTPDGGRINIIASTACIGDNDHKSGNRFLQIAISDTGVGIPRNKLSSIFDKYKQSREVDKTQGTGLGLAICQTIVQLHGGQIWAESEEGQGSVFYCRIPLSQKAPSVVLK